MTRDELRAIDEALTDALQQLRVGHIGTSVHCISGAQAIVRAELEREDRMWEKIAEEIRHAAPEVAPESPLVGTALCHDFAPPPDGVEQRDEPPSKPC